MENNQLLIKDIFKKFGGVYALNGIGLEISTGRKLGILGTNGAGKTTLINIISGAIKCDSGSVKYKNEEISHLSPFLISRLGIVRTFQHSSLFNELTIKENILLGLLKKYDYQLGNRLNALTKADSEIIQGYLKTFNISQDILDKYPSNIDYGTRRIVEIVRALLLNPAILMLDEPSTGLSDIESMQVLDALSKVHEATGIALLVIEHNLDFVFKLCNEFIFMDEGTIDYYGDKDGLLKTIPYINEIQMKTA